MIRFWISSWVQFTAPVIAIERDGGARQNGGMIGSRKSLGGKVGTKMGITIGLGSMKEQQ